MKNDFLHPSAKINYITKKDNGLAFSAELDKLYEGVIFAKREGSFIQKGLSAYIDLTDEWQLKDSMPLWVNFLAYDKWSISENTATALVNNSKLCLTFEADEEFILDANEQFIDYTGKPLYVLRVKTTSNKTHKIITNGVIM